MLALPYGIIWILDFEHVFSLTEQKIELALFVLLNAAIDIIAALWDPSKGSGALALKHVKSVSSEILKAPERSCNVDRFVREIQELCAAKFRAIAVTRSWKHIPEVINLDL